MEYYFVLFSELSTDIKWNNEKVSIASRLIIMVLFDFEDNSEFIEFIIQRMFESCKKHAYPVIGFVYNMEQNLEIKDYIAQKCFDYKLFIWNVYGTWIKRLQRDKENKENVRYIFKELLKLGGFPWQLYLNWAEFEEKNDNIGTTDDIYSAMWLYNEAINIYGDIGEVLNNYATFLFRNNITKDKEYLSSLMRKACLYCGAPDSEWFKWADFEERYGNVSYENEYSAGWIYRELCENRDPDNSAWIFWSRLIERHPNEFEEESSEAILKKACQLKKGSSIWIELANKRIKENNIGNYDIVDSASWMVKEACLYNNPEGNSLPWRKWLELVGIYCELEEYSRKEILELACYKYNISDWVLWAKLAEEEIADNNIGDYDTKGSAAWIFKEISLKVKEDSRIIWIKWAKFAEDYQAILKDQKGYSAEKIFSTACIQYHVDAWEAWALLEEKKGNIGDYYIEGSVAWIYKNAVIKYTRFSNVSVLINWASFAFEHPMYDGDTYIDMNYVLDLAHKNASYFSELQMEELIQFENIKGYDYNIKL